jgi:hypothetical protein
MTDSANPRETGIWVKPDSDSRFDRAVTAFIKRYWQGSIQDCEKLSKTGLARLEGIARQRVDRILRSVDLLDFYTSYKRIKKELPDPRHAGDLDLTIRCPNCAAFLACHNSEHMLHNVKTRYLVHCRHCKIVVKYQIVASEHIGSDSLEALEASGLEAIPLEDSSNEPLEDSNKLVKKSSNVSLETAKWNSEDNTDEEVKEILERR